MIRKNFISLLAMVATLALVYGIDSWLNYQEKLAINTNNFTPLLTWTMASHLFLIVIWLTLYWIMLVWSESSVSIGVLLLIVGIVIVIYPSIQVSVPDLPFLFTSYKSSLSYTAIFISLLGVLLLRPPTPR